MVAAQAGASLENAMLYEEIRKLFEGFVKASVEAIESRDPTTSGHSRRVADLTIELAKVVDSESSGPYKGACFSREDLRELEYASLLHDFGKIGVREKVLVKANKLYEEKVELIRARFDFVARSLEADIAPPKAQRARARAPKSELDALDKEFNERRAELDASGRPSCRERAHRPRAGDFAKVEAIAKETYFDIRGEMRFLLDADEAVALSVKRGSSPARIRRDHQPRGPHVQVPLEHPLGKAFRARPTDRRSPSRAPQRHGLSESPPRRGDPGASPR